MLSELLFNIENNENKYQNDIIVYYLDINRNVENIKKILMTF
jgi:hypothetical protein